MQNGHVMDVGASLGIRRSVRQRTDQLLWRASAANGFLKVGKAFDKEERCDVRHVEVVEQDCLIEIQAFERGFVEDENWALRHT